MGGILVVKEKIQALKKIKDFREFEFTIEDFNYIQTLMLTETGIFLCERKESMVYGRLARQLRRIGMNNFKEYFSLVNNRKDEKELFINALTTNKTQFFREKHHFDYLCDVLGPQWKADKKSRIRIWSAGCSTGEEAYTIASILASNELLTSNYNCKILATDLDTQVLNVAKKGIYPINGRDEIPELLLREGFIRGKGSQNTLLKVKPILQNSISFKALNLMAYWPHKGSFDAIFCRNVMIYFEKEIQQNLIRRFWEKLDNGGILFIGHSESIGEMGQYFENLGQTMFRKID